MKNVWEWLFVIGTIILAVSIAWHNYGSKFVDKWTNLERWNETCLNSTCE